MGWEHSGGVVTTWHILIPLPPHVPSWQELRQLPRYTETFILGKGGTRAGTGGQGVQYPRGSGGTGATRGAAECKATQGSVLGPSPHVAAAVVYGGGSAHQPSHRALGQLGDPGGVGTNGPERGSGDGERRDTSQAGAARRKPKPGAAQPQPPKLGAPGRHKPPPHTGRAGGR